MPGWEGGSTRKWRTTRLRVLRRDQHRCQLRLAGCTIRATCVHHLYGKAQGDNPAHLVAACTSCNLKVGDPQRASRDPATQASRDPDPQPRTAW